MIGSVVHDHLKSYDVIYWAGLGVTGIAALVLWTIRPAPLPSEPVVVSAE
jgi:hypothetical protein